MKAALRASHFYNLSHIELNTTIQQKRVVALWSTLNNDPVTKDDEKP